MGFDVRQHAVSPQMNTAAWFPYACIRHPLPRVNSCI